MKMPLLPTLPGHEPAAMSEEFFARFHSFSADDMKAYALAYEEAVREACAKVCEEVATSEKSQNGDDDFCRWAAASIRQEE